MLADENLEFLPRYSDAPPNPDTLYLSALNELIELRSADAEPLRSLFDRKHERHIEWHDREPLNRAHKDDLGHGGNEHPTLRAKGI